jgi:lipopolysaccharide export LptBFGC system permease protein LptF
MLRPKRLTVYILSELAAATVVAVVLWTAILMMNDLFFIARQAIEKDLGLTVTFQILALKIPNLLVLAIPIGTLLSGGSPPTARSSRYRPPASDRSS